MLWPLGCSTGPYILDSWGAKWSETLHGGIHLYNVPKAHYPRPPPPSGTENGQISYLKLKHITFLITMIAVWYWRFGSIRSYVLNMSQPLLFHASNMLNRLSIKKTYTAVIYLQYTDMHLFTLWIGRRGVIWRNIKATVFTPETEVHLFNYVIEHASQYGMVHVRPPDVSGVSDPRVSAMQSRQRYLPEVGHVQLQYIYEFIIRWSVCVVWKQCMCVRT